MTDKPVERIVVSHYHADHIYGLQAFKEHAGAPPVSAQRGALDYVGGTAASQGEDAQRRLAQRRNALFPWVDEGTYIVPGHGAMSEDAQQAVAATRDYILYVREAMAEAVSGFVPFDQAYENTDWSRYEDMPAFDASNRGNAYRIYLEEEARSLPIVGVDPIRDRSSAENRSTPSDHEVRVFPTRLGTERIITDSA